MNNNSNLTRHAAFRITPSIRPGSIVTIEATDICCHAVITDVRRTGRTLHQLQVTLVPYTNSEERALLAELGETAEFPPSAGMYEGRTSVQIKVNDDGSATLPYDTAPSIEEAR